MPFEPQVGQDIDDHHNEADQADNKSDCDLKMTLQRYLTLNLRYLCIILGHLHRHLSQKSGVGIRSRSIYRPEFLPHSGQIPMRQSQLSLLPSTATPPNIGNMGSMSVFGCA